jgi:phage tail sheath gpL-like
VSSPYEIVGFSSTDFDPGYVAQVVYGASGLAAGDIPLRLELIGNKTSAGSMVANQDSKPCFSQEEAEALVGAKSELYRMYAAAAQIPGVEIWLTPVTASAGAAATMTVTFATNATSSGTWILFFGGKRVEVAVASGDTPTVQGASLVTALAGNKLIGCTGSNSAGTVTVTWSQTGPRGNDIFVRLDSSQAPTGTTCVLGGTGGTVTGIGQQFGGGTTADDLTTVATNTQPEWYQRVALAHRDSTNLAAWETAMDAKASWQEQKPQHTVVAFNGSLSAAQSLTQTTLNNARFMFAHMLNGESDPAEIAAVIAAIRCVTEEGDPGADYDGRVLPGICPHTRNADSPARNVRVTSLRTGVSPIKTVNGEVQLVQAVTTRCLDGTIADYRTRTVGQAYVPDFVRFDTSLLWMQYRKDNPIVADDVAPEQNERPSGVATPKRWSELLYNRLKDHERGVTVRSGLPQLIDVDLNKPTAKYDKTAKRIMFAAPLVPAPRQHQIGGNFFQLS